MKKEQKLSLFLSIYTDGACSGNPGIGGWGVVVSGLDDDVKTFSGKEEKTTNNRMELTAVIEAVKIAIEAAEQLKVRVVAVIHSDSQYVVNAVNEGWLTKWQKNGWHTKTGDVKNKELWEAFLAVSKEAKKSNVILEFVKVVGHACVIMNEMADSLAVQARLG